jgi:cell division protein FtsW (lipid II flippase)
MNNQLLIGGVLGYTITNFVSGKSEGEKGLIDFNWVTKPFKIHLHHWIIFSIILLCIFVFVFVFSENKHEKKYENKYDTQTYEKNKYNLIIGFLIGGIIQGLTYTDRFKIFI